jgi:hypothetical protein
MTTNNKSTPVTPATVDPLESFRKVTSGLTETSKIIRAVYRTLDPQSDKKVAQVERILKGLGVTTKAGEPIRYQHVRNVLTQNLGAVK